MKYYIYDDCMSTRSAAWTREIKADSFEDALLSAYAVWSGLSRHDQKDRGSFLLGEVEDEAATAIADGEFAGDYMYGKTFDFAATHRIAPEYVEYWGRETEPNEVIDVDEIMRLFRERDMTADDLLKQIYEERKQY